MKIMICVAAILLSGCVETMPQADVVAAVKHCESRGGVAHIQTVSKYQSAVKWVSCYEARESK